MPESGMADASGTIVSRRPSLPATIGSPALRIAQPPSRLDPRLPALRRKGQP